jgi:hypothetical protein
VIRKSGLQETAQSERIIDARSTAQSGSASMRTASVLLHLWFCALILLVCVGSTSCLYKTS